MRYSFLKYAAIATCAAGMCLAQTPTMDPQTGSASTREEGQGRGFMCGNMDLDHVSEVLNLSEAQKTQARTIFDQARQSAQPVRQELRANREKLSAAAKVANNDSDIQKLSVEQGRLLGKLIAIHTEARAKFYQILTPEQRVKSDQMHEQMRSRMRTQSQ